LKDPSKGAPPPKGGPTIGAQGRRLNISTASRLEADFEFIAESIPHMVWVAAPDGTTEYFNRIGSDYTGLPADGNYGWNWVDLVHPEDAERARAGWAEAVRTESPYAIEHRIRRFDGVFRRHAFRAQPVRGSDGKVTKWVGTATDVEEVEELAAEVRRSQRQALESLTLLETLQSATPVGFAFVDEDLRLVRVNPPLAEIAGMPAEKLAGRNIAKLGPLLWPGLEADFRQVLKTGEALVNREQSGESGRHPGRVRNWLTSYYPVRIEDEVLGVSLVVLDVTERKSAQYFRALLTGLLEGLDADEAGATPRAPGEDSGFGVAPGEPAPPGLTGRAAEGEVSPEGTARPDRPFTARERDVLTLLARGMVAAEVAESLGIDLSTVRFHVRHILEKLGVHSQLAAVMIAVREGLVEI
jgi:PAS domain S-box-containing protein